MILKRLMPLLLLSILVTPIAFSAERNECHIGMSKMFSWPWSTETTLYYYVDSEGAELSAEYKHELFAQRDLRKLIKTGVCPETQTEQ